MFEHITVLKNELVSLANPSDTYVAVDCTSGGGGHTALLLEKVHPDGLVIAFDRDSHACHHLSTRFENEVKSNKLVIINDAFSSLEQVLTERNLTGEVDYIIADLGVSSPQLDLKDRGFSFRMDGPLDMRMDTRTSPSAAEVINSFGEIELSSIFKDLGEEPRSWHIAKKIVARAKTKPFQGTLELSEFIKENIGYKSKSKKHPATKIFQALRIFVNQELEEVSELVNSGFSALKPNGTMGIITFHSLEDRIVKHAFKTRANPKDPLPKGIPVTDLEVSKISQATGKLIKPFPILPTEEEIAHNPRARSAKLRFIKKI